MSIPNVKWQSTMPFEEGKYWFYGELNMGDMGCDYKDEYVHKPELSLVTIHCNDMASANGQIVFRRKFNKESRHSGWWGYWAAAELPESPYDGDALFDKPPEE